MEGLFVAFMFGVLVALIHSVRALSAPLEDHARPRRGDVAVERAVAEGVELREANASAAS